MKQFGLILTAFLVGTSLTYGQFEMTDKLDLKINKRKSYVAGQPVFVQLTISNPTDSIQTIEFIETHKYHGTLPYPTCIAASIMDDKKQNHCTYATQYVQWSTLFTKEDLQYVSIKPGDKLTRDLEVNQIVLDCDCFQGKGLKSGTYFITIMVHDRMTNEIKIEVK